MHDLVITGGIVHDGLGSPGVRADVAIEAGRVVAVGDDVGPACGRSRPRGGSSRRGSSTRIPTPTRAADGRAAAVQTAAGRDDRGRRQLRILRGAARRHVRRVRRGSVGRPPPGVAVAAGSSPTTWIASRRPGRRTTSRRSSATGRFASPPTARAGSSRTARSPSCARLPRRRSVPGRSGSRPG